MTTQKIGPATPNLQPISTGSSQNVSNTGSDLTASFTMVMSQTVSLKADVQTPQSKQPESDPKAAGSAVRTVTAGKSDSSKTDSSDVNNIAADANNRKTGAAGDTKDTKQADDSKDDLNEKISSAADDVRQKIKDELGVSDEDLNAVMEMLGLSNADLLNPSVIPMLVSKITGNDISAVITDETMYSQVNDILSAQREVTADLLQDLNMTPEEFREAVQKAVGTNESNGGAAGDTAVSESSIQTPVTGTENANAEIEKAADDVQNVNDVNSVKAVNDLNKVNTENTVEITSERPIRDTVRTPAEAANLNGTTSGQDTTERNSGTDENGTDNLSKITENVFGKNSKSNGNNSDFSQSGSSDPNASFFQNLTQSVNEAVNNVSESLTAPSYSAYADTQNIIDQITSQIRVALKSDQTSMEMQLNPESLGKLNIQVVSKNGAVTAQFEAQSASVKAALETQVAELKQSLENQGIRVENVEVTLASHQFEQNMMQNGNSNTQDAGSGRRSKVHHINLNDLEGTEGIEDDGSPDESVQIAKSMMKANGNSVDFTA